MKILSVEQMVRVDRLSTEKYGIPSILLMENAGIHLFLSLDEIFAESLAEQEIAILCGKGNNGGDGLVLARQLLQRRIEPDVFLLGKASEVKGDARINLKMFSAWGGKLTEVTTTRRWKSLESELNRYDILVDAMLGTGLGKPLRGIYARAVQSINQSSAFVLAVDIPSGMFSDALEGGTETVQADLTVTFTAPKIAHILNQDQEALGTLKIVPIGSPPQLMEGRDYYLNLITLEQVCGLLPVRRVDSHKGTFGNVSIVAGGAGKAGAASLSSRAALRTGSGLVTTCTPSTVQPVVACFQAEIMTAGFPSNPDGGLALDALSPILAHLQDKDAAGLGPGLGTSEETIELVCELFRQAELPLVTDADALNALARHPKFLKSTVEKPRILTPHPGEFSRLVHLPAGEILNRRVEIARDFARRHRLWLVLKGFRTLIATPDGQVHVSPLGNPGMASAGMGDVLTGVLTSTVGQSVAQGRAEPSDITAALILGVYLHGMAGDLCELSMGPESLTAGDVIDCLSSAYRSLRNETP